VRVVANNPKLVPMSKLGGGEPFRWNSMYFIRPCERVRDDHNIGGVNLENGTYIMESADTMVERVKMEAREL
jgi:hypothetical protein